MRSATDMAGIFESCLANDAGRLLLCAENLTDGLFDLRSGEAGTILEKLRNHRIRLAVVTAPATQFSRRFGELIGEERRGPHFRLAIVAEGREISRADVDVLDIRPGEKRRIVLQSRSSGPTHVRASRPVQGRYELNVFPQWLRGLPSISGEFVLQPVPDS